MILLRSLRCLFVLIGNVNSLIGDGLRLLNSDGDEVTSYSMRRTPSSRGSYNTAPPPYKGSPARSKSPSTVGSTGSLRRRRTAATSDAKELEELRRRLLNGQSRDMSRSQRQVQDHDKRINRRSSRSDRFEELLS